MMFVKFWIVMYMSVCTPTVSLFGNLENWLESMQENQEWDYGRAQI